jgi:1,4-dihydroxy-2-naphthoate octaprenyltransferase
VATVIRNWLEILQTQNLSASRRMDAVSRWLIITRASVFTMTLTSGLIGGLLALSPGAEGTANGIYFALALVGIVTAHAANNMINDYFDLESGVDTDDYVRSQYAPHPVLSGLISKRGLLGAIALIQLVDLAILVYLAQARGAAVVVFALLGLFISVFYVAPPLKLKHHGLGEPGVFVVWGPLMIGGVYFVTTGTLPPWVLAASLPYAILVTSVLIGKHVDKHDVDAAKQIRTLPVILGEARSRVLNQGLVISFFALVAVLVLSGTLGAWVLLVFLSVPRLVQVLRIYRAPRPTEAPPNYPIWPLWYVAWAFYLNRRAGALLVLGLVLNALLPISL